MKIIDQLGFSKAEADLQLSSLSGSYDTHELTAARLPSRGPVRPYNPSNVTKSTPHAPKKNKPGKKKNKRGRGRKVKAGGKLHSTSQPEAEEDDSEAIDNTDEAEEHAVQEILPLVDTQGSELSAGELPVEHWNPGR